MLNVTDKFAKILEEVVGKDREVNVWLASEQEMRDLGKQWLKDDKFHEVISFPLDEEGPSADGVWRLGDVALWENCKRKDYWLKHSCQHLLGIHHEE